MRKRLFRQLILMLVLFLLIEGNIPEYRIYSTISESGADTRNTELFVVVYKAWDTEGTMIRIVEQYRKMNSTPNRLTIHLYHSKYALNHGQAYYTEIFEYTENKVTDPPAAINSKK